MCVTTITMSVYINVKISVVLRNKIKLSERDYMFYFNQIFRLELKERVFSHIINAKFFKVIVINSTNDTIILIKRFRLKIVKEFENNDCYMIFKYSSHFAAKN